jgi:hypothetical protein
MSITSLHYGENFLAWLKGAITLRVILLQASPLSKLLVGSLLTSHEELDAYLKKKLVKIQQQMKLSADQHRRYVSYKIGDWVYVKLRPYLQTSVAFSR